MWQEAAWQPTAGDVVLAAVIGARVTPDTPVRNKGERDAVARGCIELAETIMEIRALRFAEAAKAEVAKEK